MTDQEKLLSVVPDAHRQQRQFAELAREHQKLVAAVRRLVHAKRTANVWLEHTPEFAALAEMVERKSEVPNGR